MKKNAIKSVFSDDLDVLTALQEKENKSPSLESLRELFRGEDGGTPERGVDYFTEEEVKAWKDEILDGAKPKKFVDYFTDEEIDWIKNYVKDGVRLEVTPVKGRDYDDGKPGTPGKNADESKITADVIKKVRELDEKQDEIDFSPVKIAGKLNSLDSAIDAKVIRGMITVEDIVKAIKEGKLLELRDIKNARLDSPSRSSQKFDMNDQRWHGSGGSSAGGSNIAMQEVTAVTSAPDTVTIALSQLANTFTSILMVTLNGQIINRTRWSVVGSTMTVTQAYDTDEFQIQYTYA